MTSRGHRSLPFSCSPPPGMVTIYYLRRTIVIRTRDTHWTLYITLFYQPYLVLINRLCSLVNICYCCWEDGARGKLPHEGVGSGDKAHRHEVAQRRETRDIRILLRRQGRQTGGPKNKWNKWTRGNLLDRNHVVHNIEHTTIHMSST